MTSHHVKHIRRNIDRWRAEVFVALFFIILAMPAAAQEDAMPSEPNALAFSKTAANSGKSHYLINCQQCHDADGRALTNIDFIAADLTAPGTWYYGTTPLSIFRTIKFGASLQMPPFKDSLGDETIWKIVAHVLNIGPQASRPDQD